MSDETCTISGMTSTWDDGENLLVGQPPGVAELLTLRRCLRRRIPPCSVAHPTGPRCYATGAPHLRLETGESLRGTRRLPPRRVCHIPRRAGQQLARRGRDPKVRPMLVQIATGPCSAMPSADAFERPSYRSTIRSKTLWYPSGHITGSARQAIFVAVRVVCFLSTPGACFRDGLVFAALILPAQARFRPSNRRANTGSGAGPGMAVQGDGLPVIGSDTR